MSVHGQYLTRKFSVVEYFFHFQGSGNNFRVPRKTHATETSVHGKYLVNFSPWSFLTVHAHNTANCPRQTVHCAVCVAQRGLGGKNRGKKRVEEEEGMGQGMVEGKSQERKRTGKGRGGEG